MIASPAGTSSKPSKSRMNRSRRIFLSAFTLLFLAGLLFSFHDRIFWSLGDLLVHTEKPEKADIIVVIGGDYLGNRIVKAAQLVAAGYAPRVLASGSGTMYGNFEGDLAIDFAVRHGYPRGIFTSFHFPALSTSDEAAAVVPELRAMGIHKYLLITSPSHTARARRAFMRQKSGPVFRTVASEDPYWNNGRWWTNREGRKLLFIEACKTVGDFFGM
jgi:uncharacterized SAM-binding protein YcdF (DUF218 family)